MNEVLKTIADAIAVGHRDTEKEPHEIDFDKSVSFI